MKQGKLKRIVSLLLAVLLSATTLASCTLDGTQTDGIAKDAVSAPEEGQTEQTEKTEEDQKTDGSREDKVFYEVCFDYAEGTTDEEKELIILPERRMVEAGTDIRSIDTPKKEGGHFVCWFYDSALEKMVLTEDKVEKNLTLYPKFVEEGGLDDYFKVDYVANQEVGTDFSVPIVSYNLTKDEVLALLSVRNISEGETEVEFTLNRMPQKLDLSFFELTEEEEAFINEAVIRKIDELNQEDAEEEAEAAEKAEEAEASEESEEAEVAEKSEEAAETEDEKEADGEEIPEAEEPVFDMELLEEFEGYSLIRTLLEESFTEEITEYIAERYASDELRFLGLAENPYEKFLEELGVSEEEFSEFSEEGLKEWLEIDEEDSLERYLIEDAKMDPQKVFLIEELLDQETFMDERFASYWEVVPAAGKWKAGRLFQTEIKDTENVRFIYQDEETEDYVSYYNFTVFKEDVDTMRLNSGVKFLNASEVTGVDMSGSMYATVYDEAGNPTLEKKNESGTLTYSGSETLLPGDTAAVYNGTLNPDGTVDGEVNYLNILSENQDGSFSYETADFEDVVFVPDVIPVEDDGTFDDGEVFLTNEFLLFEDPFYEVMGLDADVVVENGDYLAFYTGDIHTPETLELVSYACVLEVSEETDGIRVSYTPVSQASMEEACNLYMTMEGVPFDITEEEQQALGADMEKQLVESGFADQFRDNMVTLLLDPEYEEHAEEYQEMFSQVKFLTDDGSEMSVGDVRKLAGGSGGRVNVGAVTASFAISGKLAHFEGTTGVRGEGAVSFKVEIDISNGQSTDGGKKNQIEINLAGALEQEVTLGFKLDVSVKWGWEWIFYVPKDITADVGFTAGTYTGIGFTGTVQTKSESLNKDKEWSELINLNNQSFPAEAQSSANGAAAKLKSIGEGLSKIKTGLEKAENGGGMGKGYNSNEDVETEFHSAGIGGSFEDKYAGFIKNDSEYVDIICKKLTNLSFRPGLGLIEFTITPYFVVSMKLNAMLGFGISYGNAKQFCFHFELAGHVHKTSTADLETPNFNADLYIFGMIGFRVGPRIDIRVGVLSTSFDSVGVVVNLGLQAEFYGYVYVSYHWESGKGSSMSALGSLFVQLSLFVDLDLMAQLGNGKLSTTSRLCSLVWPILQLGDAYIPRDFAIDENDKKLNLTIPKGKNTIQVPDELFKIKCMDIRTGDEVEQGMDSSKKGSVNYSFSNNGTQCTQYNEEHFTVTCSNRSFQYLPESNLIMVEPLDQSVMELETEIRFTYINTCFGFDTAPIERVVKVKWQGTSANAQFEYYQEQDDGSFELVESEKVTGCKDVRYRVNVDDKLVNRYEFMELSDVHVPSEEKIAEDTRDYNSLSIFEKISYALTKALREAAEKQRVADYRSGIASVVKSKAGTISFLLSEDGTKVQFYYKKQSGKVSTANAGTELVEKSYNYNKYTLNAGSDLYAFMDGIYLKSVPEGYRVEYRVLKGYPDSPASGKIIQGTDPSDYPLLLKGDKLAANADLYIVAFQVPDTYTVTYMDGGKEAESREVTVGKVIPDGPALEKTGYTLKGWETEDGELLSAAAKMPGNDIELNAVWEVNVHTVTYEIEGEVYAEKEIAYNEPITLPKYEKEQDYVASKWYLNRRLLLVGERMKDQDITLVADWVHAVHQYDDGTVSVEPDCSNEGLKVYTCECGTKKEEILEKDPERHVSSVLQNAAEATCEEAGYTGDTVCEACGELLEKGEIIPATGHLYDGGVIIVGPDCITEGLMVYTCTVCEKTREEILPIDPDKHGETIVTGRKEATCEEAGYTGDKVCEACGAVAETGTEIPATGHTYSSGLVTVIPDCCTEGEQICTCSACGKTETLVMPKDSTQHRSTGMSGMKEATCEEDGYTGDTVCLSCGAVITEGSIIPKTGHSYSDEGVVTTPPSVSTPGERTHTCDTCRKTFTEPEYGIPSIVFYNKETGDGDERLEGQRADLNSFTAGLPENAALRDVSWDTFNVLGDGERVSAWYNGEKVSGTITWVEQNMLISEMQAQPNGCTVNFMFTPDESCAGMKETGGAIEFYRETRFRLSLMTPDREPILLPESFQCRYNSGDTVNLKNLAETMTAHYEDYNKTDRDMVTGFRMETTLIYDAADPAANGEFVMPDHDVTLYPVWGEKPESQGGGSEMVA